MDFVRKSTSIITDPNTIQNESELIDLVMRIRLIRAILSSRLSNLTLHFRMFLYLATWLLRIMVSLLCRSQVVSKMHDPIYHYQISEGDEMVELVTVTATKP